MKHVTIITDGACFPNPGHGGWAAILRFGSNAREISGNEAKTTNNRMEFRAVIEGLSALKEPCRVTIRTDSKTVIAWCAPKAFTKLKQINKFPQVHVMVTAYRLLSKTHEVSLEWVKGHVGDPDNERADYLANVAASQGMVQRQKAPF